MGFGSYDESEQGNQEVNTEDIEDGENQEKADADGDMEFEFGESGTDELVDALDDMRD